MTGRRETPTRVTLWRLLVALLAASVAVVVTSVWAFAEVHDTAAEFRAHSVPSIVGVATARAALVEADTAAIGSFSSGEVLLAGPGQRYQTQIAVASQSLAQVAENNIAGAPASQQLQMVEGLLVAYTGLIEQADAHYRQDGDRALGAADLWYASHLLHDPGTGILVQLDALRDKQKAALARQLTTGGMSVGWVYAWTVSGAVLLVLLVVAQAFLRRRFRRVVSLPLAGATALLIVVLAAMTWSLDARQQVTDAGRGLSFAYPDWRGATSLQGQRGLAILVHRDCGNAGGCGETIDRFVAELASATPTSDVTDARVTDEIRRIDDLAGRPADTRWVRLLVLVAALAVVALVPLGLYPRIEEYRYRPR
jgi:hypothetical protein